MDQIIIDRFNDNNVNNALSTKLLNEILDVLASNIKDNEKLIIENNKIDYEHNRKNIDIKILLNIIESYKDWDFSVSGDERNIVVYNGDPYLTLEFCIATLLKDEKLLLCINREFMLGVNEILFNIIEKVLTKYNIQDQIFKVIKLPIEDYSKFEYDEIDVVGDSAFYEKLKRKYQNVVFSSYNNIGIYCESEELQDLRDAMYIYATENLYEYEDIDVSNVDEAIEYFNEDDTKDVVILLTKSQESKIKFKENITGKLVFINENPFHDEYRRIEKFFI